MKKGWVILEPFGRVVVRDGRPFGGENRTLYSLPWPLPPTTAGAVRTLVGSLSAPGHAAFSTSRIALLKQIVVQGPMLTVEHVNGTYEFFVPAPRDVWMARAEGRMKLGALVPMRVGDDADTDLPIPRAFACPPGVDKPLAPPAFWSLDAYLRWMSRDHAKTPMMEHVGEDPVSALSAYLFEPEDANSARDRHFRPGPTLEWRTHVQMEGGHRKTGGLYSPSGLRFQHHERLACFVTLPDALEDVFEDCSEAVGHLGGERGLARVSWKPAQHAAPAGWGASRALTEPYRSGDLLRMALITPCPFARGWLPTWLDERLEGTWPGTQMRVRLETAIVSRYVPVSGWSLAEPRGPKPMRKCVPAGSVYFFTVLEEDPHRSIRPLDLWWSSVADDPQDACDGFGIVAVGRWSWREDVL
ncbi:type III-B CRISPR module-associated Cmr3 family protein [Alicyclobacillus vulcanalis]|uniref:CRISPR-associated protein Cmr3 n=1 Tax=Alicyclobacillus vulcanalis TaxID=252246 RepID=A0A1N7K6K7_9BACL|nr:type III-B CRISPR module-associated Cmr3 family protein [Alicyclobacillus vulcanalis]SIS57186.1 CRISPR-associated protein Cmr3 [Alicyclobacillus vulcanalis]